MGEWATGDQWSAYRKELIRVALDGDVSSGYELIDLLLECIQSNDPLPDEMRNYLLKSLGQVASGTDPGSAFALKPRRGRRNSPADRDRAVVAFVWLMMRSRRPGTPECDETLPAMTPRGMSLADAKDAALDEISQATGKAWDVRRVEQIIDGYRRSLDGHADPLAQLADQELAAVADIQAAFEPPLKAPPNNSG